MDTHTKRLDYSDLRSINAAAPATPVLSPTLESSEALQCPVCLEFKGHNVVIHLECWRLVCIPCTLALIDNFKDCPLCRGKLRQDFGPTWVIKPPPIVKQIIDNVDYKCNQCNLIMKERQARTHLNRCEHTERHQPPAHIPPRGENQLVFKELVSNPPVLSRQFSTSDRRLVIQYHNGRQVTSKVVPASHTVEQWKMRLSNIIGANVGDIKMYKFMHRELKNDELIRDVAKTRGATYLTSFANDSDFSNLATHSANLILHELGPEPIIPRPVEQTSSDWDTSWAQGYSVDGWDPIY